MKTRTSKRFAVTTVVDHVLRTGKDEMDPAIASLSQLVRSERGADDADDAVLDCVLDKAEGHYSYRSYLGLGILEPLLPAPDRVYAADQLVPLLLTDLLRFENFALEIPTNPRLPLQRPDRSGAHRRIGKAQRLVAALTARYGAPSPVSEDDEHRIACSVLPVSQLHDEYLFIRVLQCYESTFMAMALLLEQALQAALVNDAGQVAHRVAQAAARLDDVAGLFSLLATMPPDNFRTFRDQTSGSSAIQSASYKAFELVCAVPTSSRLNSLAFAAVPELHERARSGPASLSSWFLSRSHALDDQRRQAVTDAFAALESAHQKWKRTHYSLSVRMIGEATGTGGTEGVGYLRSAQDNRLFWPLAERFPELLVHRMPPSHGCPAHQQEDF